jgi:hypothetical protein
MKQFEAAVKFDVSSMIVEGKMVAVETTSSYCSTLYLIGMKDEDGNFPYIAYDYDNGCYCGMGIVTPKEYADHYNEAKVEGVKIWESEDDYE